jgi:hypothetical protein
VRVNEPVFYKEQNINEFINFLLSFSSSFRGLGINFLCLSTSPLLYTLKVIDFFRNAFSIHSLETFLQFLSILFYFWFNEKIPSPVLISSINIKFILLKAFTDLKNITQLPVFTSVLNFHSQIIRGTGAGMA